MNNYIKVLKSKHNHYDMIKQDQLKITLLKKVIYYVTKLVKSKEKVTEN